MIKKKHKQQQNSNQKQTNNTLTKVKNEIKYEHATSFLMSFVEEKT